MTPIEGGVAFHVSCHSRAQNIGRKGAELLELIPQADVAVVERCSGHGGAWGYKKGNFEVAMKVGKPAMRLLDTAGKKHVVSECPLAGIHLEQGIEALGGETPKPERVGHPVVLMARAYGIPSASE
jgi:glycerol-3-phosphate dehydrogenase subunit C